MALKILVAGVSKDERAQIENSVKQALGWRATSETWTVSLVRVGAQWSVTLNGPGEAFRNVSFAAERRGLTEAIGEALERGGVPAPAPAPAPSVPTFSPPAAAPTTAPGPPPGAVGQEGRHACTKCGQGFVVLYEAQADDSMVMAPVACPHCWEINRVEIGSWAASGRDYRAEKA
jgi:hypothetical protein